jgi:putative cardiolipin synthase
MGVDVDSPELAATMARDIVESLPRTAYRLRLRRSGALQWIFADDGVEVRANSEPDTTFGRRFKVRLMGYLPIEGQM